MPFALFHDLFPEIAERENRTITVFPGSEYELPAAEYSFLEMYCNEPGCDCRRVFFYVMSSLTERLEAVVAYGWEPHSFYAAWLREDDPHLIAELKGPSLNVGSPQSQHAPAILDLARHLLLRDNEYIERLKRHYNMFRNKIDGLERDKEEIAGDLFGFGGYEGECSGCDEFRTVNDLGLCDECAGKLDRDLIRQRDWDYSASAFGVPPEGREKLRREVIARYGDKMELISPSQVGRPKGKKKKKKHENRDSDR